jgi:molybdate transport system substrate-binding protein
MRARLVAFPILAAALLAFAARSVVADELYVLAAGAVQAVFLGTKADFERESGHTLRFAFAPVGTQRDKVIAGEPADVTAVSDAAIKVLAERNLLIAESRTNLGTVGSGVAIKTGASRPKIATADELRATLLAAKAIAYPDPGRGATAGIHFAGVLEKLGIADQVKSKTILAPAGMAAIERVAAGEAEIGVTQASEILATPGATLIGPLPPEFQNTTTYGAAAIATTKSPDAARDYLRFLSSAPVRAKLAAMGFEPPG